MIAASNDVEHYSSLYQMEKDGNYLYVLQFKIHSNKCDIWWRFIWTLVCICSDLSCVGFDGNVWLKCAWELVSEEYKRPAIGQGCCVSFPVPDGQNSASSSWALCCDWLNACPYGERVSECFYSIYVCGEMKRLQTEEEGRMRMGSLNAIVFSCGTVIIYLTGVDVRRWLAILTEKQPVPFLVPAPPAHVPH